MDLGIKGRTALVVGGSRGVGRAVVDILAAEGVRVLAVARDADRLKESPAADAMAVDLMMPGAVDNVIEWASMFPIDIIYHCLGGSLDGARDVHSRAQDYARVWRLNMGIGVEINNAFIPSMQGRGWGRVVHTLSDAVKNSIGNVPYTSAKFALQGYVKVASKLFAKDGVILSAVSPGPIYTPGRFIYSQSEEWTQEYFAKYLPQERFGTDQEVAGVVAFLCSNHASFMPGAVVDVQGGAR